MKDWKPGDVGLTAKGALALRYRDGWIDSHGAPWSTERFPGNVRPLAAIDYENREQVERLYRLYYGISEDAQIVATALVDQMQAALREYAEPTPAKPEVYEHLQLQRRGKTVESICGKAWIPSPDVTVVGKCPTCLSRNEGWIA